MKDKLRNMNEEDWVGILYKDAVYKISTSKQKLKVKEYLDEGKFSIVDQGQYLIGGYTNDETKVLNCNLPVVVFGDHTKNIKLINFKFVPGADGTKVLEPSKYIIPEYISHLTQILVFKIKDKGYARHYQHIEKEFLPLAPLPIQRAIVSKIETLFSDLDNGIANLKKAQEQLKTYRQAVLKKAFEGELTKEWRENQTDLPTAEELLKQIKEERQNHYNKQLEDWEKAVKAWEKNGKEGKKPTKPKKGKEKEPITKIELKNLFNLQKGGAWRKIGETCVVKGGKRLPKGHCFSKEKTSYNYIMAGNLKNGTVSTEVNYIKKETYNELYHYRVNKGDAYITIVGACIGDAGVIPEIHHLSILTENAAKIICTESLSSKYLSFWLNSLVAQIRIKRSVFSMTLGKLALSRVEEIEFPLCSLPEQHQIVQEIETRLSVCDKVAQSISESLEKAKALRQSILKKAFEGKLLSQEEIAACKQEADYEPASVLLEKIKAEKVKKEQEAKKTKKKTRK